MEPFKPLHALIYKERGWVFLFCDVFLSGTQWDYLPAINFNNNILGPGNRGLVTEFFLFH
jgi:hypothetical protein